MGMGFPTWAEFCRDRICTVNIFIHDFYVIVEPFFLAAGVIAVLVIGVAIVWWRRRR
jgi:hypothetical protein